VLRDGRVAPAPEVYAGVCADECAQLMVDFFKERRP
jgi:cytosine/adenosine deaminase